jgi:hypothetical protein
MRWTLTIKDQTYGVHTEIKNYECRVTRLGGDIRLSVQNAKPGGLREGRFLMPPTLRDSWGVRCSSRALQRASVSILSSPLTRGMPNGERTTTCRQALKTRSGHYPGNGIGPEVTDAVQRILGCRKGAHRVSRVPRWAPRQRSRPESMRRQAAYPRFSELKDRGDHPTTRRGPHGSIPARTTGAKVRDLSRCA